MAIGKITGSVVADNTLTESNLAFGVSGQSAASAWATDTLKVNIIESDDSTAIQINDSINVSGDITTAGTVEMDRLSLSSNQTTVPPLQLTANSLQDGVGALRIDGSQADIFLNPSTATHTTVTFAVNNDQRLAFGMDNASDFYITRRTGGSWYDDTFVIDRDTGELRYGYDVTVSGSLSVNSIASSDSTAIQLNDGLNVSGALTVNNDLYLPDGKKLYLGDSNDVQIYQDSGSTASFIHKQTAGDFYIKANTNLFLQTATSQASIYAFSSGAVELYHNASKKFETTSTGAEVTGELKVDSITSNDSSALTLNSPIIAGSSFKFDGDAQAITTVLDEDTMSSDSATALATQQSIKAYVDSATASLSTTTITEGNSSVVVADSGTGTVTVTVDGNTEMTVTDAGVQLGGTGARVNSILDEDTLSSDSATALATQQSIKAYVDAETANIASDTLTFTNKTFDANGTGNSISNIEVADFAPASIINVAETLASNDSDTALVTAGAIIDYVDAQDANIASDTLTFTNKTFDANGTGNSLSNVDVADFASGVFLDEDNMASNSATAIASQQSIKAYVDSATSSIVTQIGISDSSSNSSTLTLGINDLEFRSGDSITATVAGTGVTFDLNETISVDTITSGDSTAVTFNSPILVSSISSADSTAINITDAKLYVNGSTVLTVNTADEPAVTTAIGDVDHILINDGGIAKRIALANIDISSFNNDAGYAAGGVSGFSTSTTTSFPTSSDSVARDYGDGEPVGVGTGSSENTDAFGVALGTTYDCMEPNGSLTTTDLGTEEAYVGA